MKKVTSTPVYVPRTTYKYENDLPIRSESQGPEPEPPRQTRQSLYVSSPNYYRYLYFYYLSYVVYSGSEIITHPLNYSLLLLAYQG